MSTRERVVIRPTESKDSDEMKRLVEDTLSARIDNYEIKILDDGCVFARFGYVGVSPRKSSTAITILELLEPSEWVSAAYASYNDTSDGGSAWFFKPLLNQDDKISHTPEVMISLFISMDKEEDIDLSDDEVKDKYGCRDIATVVDYVEYTPFNNRNKVLNKLSQYELSDIKLT